MKKNNKKNVRKLIKAAPPMSSFETRFQQALLVADSLSREVEELRHRGDLIAVDLAKKCKNDETSHELVKMWWEVRV